MLLRTVNHLFLWAMASMAMLNNQMVTSKKPRIFFEGASDGDSMMGLTLVCWLCWLLYGLYGGSLRTRASIRSCCLGSDVTRFGA